MHRPIVRNFRKKIIKKPDCLVRFFRPKQMCGIILYTNGGNMLRLAEHIDSEKPKFLPQDYNIDRTNCQLKLYEFFSKDHIYSPDEVYDHYHQYQEKSIIERQFYPGLYIRMHGYVSGIVISRNFKDRTLILRYNESHKEMLITLKYKKNLKKDSYFFKDKFIHAIGLVKSVKKALEIEAVLVII